MQYVRSRNVSPYRVKGAGAEGEREGEVAALVGRGDAVGSGELCSDEHASKSNAKVKLNSMFLVRAGYKLLIRLLLADGVLQNTQSFYLHEDLVAILQFADS